MVPRNKEIRMPDLPDVNVNVNVPPVEDDDEKVVEKVTETVTETEHDSE